MGYKWDNSQQRYFDDNGAQVSRDVVFSAAQKSLLASKSKIDTMSESASSLSPSDWYKTVSQALKIEYIRQYSLAYGGIASMTPSAWGKIGSMLREQFAYLKRFSSEVAGLTPGEISARLSMYFNSSREAFESAMMERALDWGAEEEAWNTSRVRTNCDDCIGYESEGKKSVGYFPLPGAGKTRCITNCGCFKTYYKSGSKEAYYE